MTRLPLRLLLVASLSLLGACALPVPVDSTARVVLFGEQHDQPDQQRRVAATVARLAARGELAGLVLEMAERGRDTRPLDRSATMAEVRDALQWRGWPWDAYADIVMSAVRAGVPVWGGNLPRAAMRPTMGDPTLEDLIPPPARVLLVDAVRDGHCGLLPASQEAPMLRIQIARDRALATTVSEVLASAERGRRVVLLAGAQHVSRDRGVPLHLDRSLPVQVVVFGGRYEVGLDADSWHPAVRTPRPDPCEDLRRRGMNPRS